MNNKIPPEIEEKEERDLLATLDMWENIEEEQRLSQLKYLLSEKFQSGQKQNVDDVLKLIDDLLKGFVNAKNPLNMSNEQIIFYHGVDMAYKQFIKRLEELKAQIKNGGNDGKD